MGGRGGREGAEARAGGAHPGNRKLRRWLRRLASGLIIQGVPGVPWDPFAPPWGPPGPSQDPV